MTHKHLSHNRNSDNTGITTQNESKSHKTSRKPLKIYAGQIDPKRIFPSQHTDMSEEMRVETMELCVTACEKFATNNEVSSHCHLSEAFLIFEKLYNEISFVIFFFFLFIWDASFSTECC